MAKYLIQSTEVYRVANEAEAKALIEESKDNIYYNLAKYSSEYKSRSKSGEIIDEYYKVTLVKKFCNEKEPDSQTEVYYDVTGEN